MRNSVESVPAGRRMLVVAPQPFYSDRGTPIAIRQLLEALSELGYQPDVLTYPLGRSPEIPKRRWRNSFWPTFSDGKEFLSGPSSCLFPIFRLLRSSVNSFW